MSTITGDTEFNNANNNGSIDGTATFNGTSQNSGEVEGSAIFNDSAENNGTVENGVFYDSSSNNGEVIDFAVFLDGAQNNGTAGTVVTEPPAITQQPASVCVNSGNGGVVLFTAAASGDLVNHKWVVDGVDREENEGGGAAYSGNSAELNLSINAGQTYQTNVKCRFYNPIGSVETNVVVASVGSVATVFDPPVVGGAGQQYTAFSSLQVFVEGVSYAEKVYLQFQVDYSGNGNAYVDYGDILEITTSGYPAPGSSASNFSALLDSGVMLLSSGISWRSRVKVYDCFGAGNTTGSWAVTTTAGSLTPTITLQPVSGSAYTGENVTFTVEAEDNFPGSNSVTYQWWIENSTSIVGATTNTLNVEIPLGLQEGESTGVSYVCKILSPYYSDAPEIFTTNVTATSLGDRPSSPPEE